MADPKRLDAPNSEAALRDSRTEALLVEGLDKYFAGHYEAAIHLWTRVLFLDRTHARARAYIDRARTTLAERQRQGEEMLQASHELLEQGRTADARHLLTEAVATSGDDDRASALRVKLERQERIDRADRDVRAGGRRASDKLRTRLAETPIAWRAPAAARGWLVLTLGALAVALVALATNAPVPEWLGSRSPSDQLAVTSTESRWPPVLSSADVALVRARNLYNRGRLAEALQALDRIDERSPQRSAADNLRIDIEQLLLAGGPDHPASKVDRR
jgi:tetratricopeptide (TPR) repeat protein